MEKTADLTALHKTAKTYTRTVQRWQFTESCFQVKVMENVRTQWLLAIDITAALRGI